MYFDDPNFLFFFITLVALLELYLITSLYCFIKFYLSNKGKTREERDYLFLLVGLCFILLGWSRLIWSIFDIYTDFNLIGLSFEALMIWKIGANFLMLSGFFFFLYISRDILKSQMRRGLSAFFLLLQIIGTLIPELNASIIIMLIGSFALMPFLLFYIYIAIKNKGRLRIKAIFVFFGYLGLSYSNLIITDLFLPIMGVMTSPQRMIAYGIVFIIKIISLIVLFIGFRMELPEDVIKKTPEKNIIIKSLGLNFRRKQEITEEEVTVSREKKICLVCKGKVSEFNVYLCPNCETFYCQTCARALINLENACWACNSPIDKTKPVNIKKEEPIESDIDTQIKNK